MRIDSVANRPIQSSMAVVLPRLGGEESHFNFTMKSNRAKLRANAFSATKMPEPRRLFC
jgi:hypothetical protein